MLKCFPGSGPTFDRQLRLCLKQRTSLTQDFLQKNPELHVILRTERRAGAEPTGADSETPIGFGEVGLLLQDLERGACCGCSALLTKEKNYSISFCQRIANKNDGLLLVAGHVCGSSADFSCVILAGKSKEVILLSTNTDLSRLNSYVQCHHKQN